MLSCIIGRVEDVASDFAAVGSADIDNVGVVAVTEEEFGDALEK